VMVLTVRLRSLTLLAPPLLSKTRMSPLTGAPTGFQFVGSDQDPPDTPTQVLIAAAAGATVAPERRITAVAVTVTALANTDRKVSMMIDVSGQLILCLSRKRTLPVISGNLTSIGVLRDAEAWRQSTPNLLRSRPEPGPVSEAKGGILPDQSSTRFAIAASALPGSEPVVCKGVDDDCR
jgi:hypothetical protein